MKSSVFRHLLVMARSIVDTDYRPLESIYKCMLLLKVEKI